MKRNGAKKLHYITEYPEYEDGIQVRSGIMSCRNKGDYIISVLSEIGYDVEIISDARYVGKKHFLSGRRNRISDHLALVNFNSFRFNNPLLRRIDSRLCKYQMFLYVLFRLNTYDTVIVYHGYEYAGLIYAAYRLKRFNLILEIEDIYHQVWNIRKKFVFDEKRLLICSKKNIVVSDTMSRILNKKGSLVCYGAYKPYDGDIEKKPGETKISVVCTGSFDAERGTGLLALEVIRLLPDNYVLLMSGIVQHNAEKRFISGINRINKDAGFEKCRFLGQLSDYDYEKLLLKADVAINTQKEGDYSAYIFPSKIIKYLSYNLDVVTTPGRSIIDSPLSNCLHISKDYSPSGIADTIMKIDIGNHDDYRDRLKELHLQFKEDLRNLVENNRKNEP